MYVCMYVCMCVSIYVHVYLLVFCFFHPLRTYLFYIYTCIGTVLNYAVFTSEILDEPERACDFSKSAYSAAIRDIQLNEKSAKPVLINKHSKLLLQLLLDDIQLWKSLRNDKKEHIMDYIKPHHEKTTAPSSPVQDKEDSVDH